MRLEAFDVINHLRFHKAMIDDNEDASRINGYLDLVQNTESGEHHSISDPFDKSIALSFELVMQEHLDPWDIDLVKFSTMYLKKARERKVDLTTAGRIIVMAWTILKMQSEKLVTNAQKINDEPEELTWDDISTDGWYGDDESYEYTMAVRSMPSAPIDEKVRHRGERKVTLMELVEAFEDVRKEVELRNVMEERRRGEAAKHSKLVRGKVDGMMHKEDLEAEIEEVWGRINRFNGQPIPLCDICDTRNREDVMLAMTSILFLARDEKVKIWQRKFPYGMIYVRNLIKQNGGGS